MRWCAHMRIGTALARSWSKRQPSHSAFCCCLRHAADLQPARERRASSGILCCGRQVPKSLNLHRSSLIWHRHFR